LELIEKFTAGVKTPLFMRLYGTAKAMPFQNEICNQFSVKAPIVAAAFVALKSGERSPFPAALLFTRAFARGAALPCLRFSFIQEVDSCTGVFPSQLHACFFSSFPSLYSQLSFQLCMALFTIRSTGPLPAHR
jgi:hypothetical protein